MKMMRGANHGQYLLLSRVYLHRVPVDAAVRVHNLFAAKLCMNQYIPKAQSVRI